MGNTKIKLLVSYDGTDFCGWQKQRPQDQVSVQQTLEKALSQLLNEQITIFGSGRTDAGVHAIGQVAHFTTTKNINREWDFCWAVRALLPPSITVKRAWIAPEEFHATLSATHKTYRYWIYNGPRHSALLWRYSEWARKPLDLDYLNSVSKYLVGKQDFKSFQTAGTEVAHTVREIYEAKWTRRNGHLIEFKITGDGFLKQMVRNIVGCQQTMARKGLEAEYIQDIIAAQDRNKSGQTAPPQGLFLWKVYYPENIDKSCRELDRP